jgi:hypothetical protein
MSERPAAADLLDEARRTLLEVLLPLLPQDRRYDGLMIANAMAIASREARLGADVLREEVRRLATLLEAERAADGRSTALRLTLRDLEQQLAQELRQGVYDNPGPRRDAVRAYLRVSTEARVRVSNPKVLTGREQP